MRRFIWTIIIICLIGVGLFKINQKNDYIDEENNFKASMEKCKLSYKMQKEIKLFWKTLIIPKTNCEKEIKLGSSIENYYISHFASVYKWNNITAVEQKQTEKNLIDNIRIWEVYSTINTDEASPIAIKLLDEITENSQLQEMGDFKIILNLWPTWDTPRSRGNFTISIIWTTGNLTYFTQTEYFRIPILSDIIEYAETYVEKKGNWETNTEIIFQSKEEQNIFNTFANKFWKDIYLNNYNKPYKSMIYISEIIEKNKTYKDIAIKEAQKLINSLLN